MSEIKTKITETIASQKEAHNKLKSKLIKSISEFPKNIELEKLAEINKGRKEGEKFKSVEAYLINKYPDDDENKEKVKENRNTERTRIQELAFNKAKEKKQEAHIKAHADFSATLTSK